MHLLYRSNNFWNAPCKSSCVSVSLTFVTASFISPILSQRQPLSLGNWQKSQGARSGLWCSDFLTAPTPLIFPHRLPAVLESLMPLKNWCLIYTRWSKSSLKHSIRVCGIIFPSLKDNFIAYRSSKVSSRLDYTFEIHEVWQSGFSRVYPNCCCSCLFEAEIIKVSQPSHKMYSNNILKFQGSTTILNACTKEVWKLIVCPMYLNESECNSETGVRTCFLWFCSLSL